jgi:hypothetical protein
VRSRVGLGASTAAGKTAFRQAVWAERDHELFGEGMTKFDLVRQGRWLALSNAPSAVYPADGPCATYNPAGYALMYPLPVTELNSNNMATQNPGY